MKGRHYLSYSKIYVKHKDMENTCCLNKGSGEVFVTYFSSIESNETLMEADGYKGQVERKLVGCTLNKSAVSAKTQNGNIFLGKHRYIESPHYCTFDRHLDKHGLRPLAPKN